MSMRTIIFFGCLLHCTGAVYYCNVADPCGQANWTQFFEPYARFENCQHNNNGFCDRYITPKWYRVNDVMLTQCPSLLSCGTLYPVWLNGTLPTITDGAVDRKACKVGFESCCTRTYDIQIKHCGSFYAYCLAALDTCPERYCFGEQGVCEIPMSSTQVATTTTVTQTTPSMSTSCLDDPCIESIVASLNDQKSRSLHCGYKEGDDCDNEITSRWYKADSPMVTKCPGLLSCGAIYPVWLNGTIPSTGDGVVTRQACQRGFRGCCATSYDIKVKNCGRYTAYCLGAVSNCPSRYCFGTDHCNEKKEKDSNNDGDNKHSHKNLEILLGVVLVILSMILAVLLFCHFKRFMNSRGKTGSTINIQQTEKNGLETRVNPMFDQSMEDPKETRVNPLFGQPMEAPPPYSP